MQFFVENASKQEQIHLHLNENHSQRCSRCKQTSWYHIHILSFIIGVLPQNTDILLIFMKLCNSCIQYYEWILHITCISFNHQQKISLCNINKAVINESELSEITIGNSNIKTCRSTWIIHRIFLGIVYARYYWYCIYRIILLLAFYLTESQKSYLWLR